MTLLAASGLGKRFGGVVALGGVDFDLRAGEIHALCGENGAGKSTLIKILGGIHAEYEGTLRIDDRQVQFRSVRDAEQAGIAVIHQELALVEEMTVAENVFLGVEPRRGPWIDWDRMVQDARALFHRFEIAIDVDAEVRTLGIARRQLVEIAKALRKQSRILILDEPTAALAEHEAQALLGMLRDLRARGIAIVYVSHRLDEVLAIADRITVLRDGRSITTLPANATSKPELIRHMVGREITDLYPARSSNIGAPLLRVENLDVDGPVALRGISFEAHAGEVLGIGGLMGAGRTELLMHLVGAFGTRRSGRVTIDGQPLAAKNPRAALAAGIVLVSEDRKRYGLVLDQDLVFNLSLSIVDRFGPIVDEPLVYRKTSEMRERLRIKARDLEVAARTLSGGNQQKVVLGKALLAEPRVVLLDEPTRGIDVGAKAEVYELLAKLAAEGKAVVLVSSELPELLGLSDRIVMLHEGQVTGLFDRAGATQEKLLAAAMGQS